MLSEARERASADVRAWFVKHCSPASKHPKPKPEQGTRGCPRNSTPCLEPIYGSNPQTAFGGVEHTAAWQGTRVRWNNDHDLLSQYRSTSSKPPTKEYTCGLPFHPQKSCREKRAYCRNPADQPRQRDELRSPAVIRISPEVRWLQRVAGHWGDLGLNCRGNPTPGPRCGGNEELGCMLPLGRAR